MRNFSLFAGVFLAAQLGLAQVNGHQRTYTVAGNVSVCSSDVAHKPSVRFEVTDQDQVQSVYSDRNGLFEWRAESMNPITIAPVVSNAYFTFDPPLYQFTPTSNQPFAASFCLVPNGVFRDLDIEMIPLDAARPGQDAHYKLVFANKGTQTQSGQVSLAFPDNVLDLIQAQPAAIQIAPNQVSWDFANLHPFESREIEVIFRIRTTDDHAASALGKILDFKAYVHSGADETPDDNTKSLVQTVVSSFESNDKLVAQGDTITPDQLDEYLNYTVRFKNTGNYMVQTVVVKDYITTNLDLATLQTTTASHPYRAVLKNDKLEIIFENINLPPASANEAMSQGYATFKVKPKTAVGIGDVIENTAEIYLDFELPITTNTVTTTVMQTLVRDTFDDALLVVYPNPATDIVYIKSPAQLEKVTIYNALGQTMLTTGSTTIDTSAWAAGFYFVKAMSDGKTEVRQFIKR